MAKLTGILRGNNTGFIPPAPIPKKKERTPVSNIKTFVRSRVVTFTAEGLKPNTVYYPFFNGIFVGQYCSAQDSPEFNDSVVIFGNRRLRSDSLGNLTGNFYIPAYTFNSGSCLFQLVDNTDPTSGLERTPDPVYGSAEAVYTANGSFNYIENNETPDSIDPSTDPPNLPQPVITVIEEPPVDTSAIDDGIVEVPTPVEYRQYYFEYITLYTEKKQHVVQNSTATPPSDPNILIDEGATISYVSTRSERVRVPGPLGLRGNKFITVYYHTFQTIKIVENQYKYFWEGPLVDRPVFATFTSSFKPSGLKKGTQVVIKSSGWVDNGAIARSKGIK